jgi:hypothetical protein
MPLSAPLGLQCCRPRGPSNVSVMNGNWIVVEAKSTLVYDMVSLAVGDTTTSAALPIAKGHFFSSWITGGRGKKEICGEHLSLSLSR